jgi:hypothetical protein
MEIDILTLDATSLYRATPRNIPENREMRDGDGNLTFPNLSSLAPTDPFDHSFGGEPLFTSDKDADAYIASYDDISLYVILKHRVTNPIKLVDLRNYGIINH